MKKLALLLALLIGWAGEAIAAPKINGAEAASITWNMDGSIEGSVLDPNPITLEPGTYAIIVEGDVVREAPKLGKKRIEPADLVFFKIGNKEYFLWSNSPTTIKLEEKTQFTFSIKPPLLARIVSGASRVVADIDLIKFYTGEIKLEGWITKKRKFNKGGIKIKIILPNGTVGKPAEEVKTYQDYMEKVKRLLPEGIPLPTIPSQAETAAVLKWVEGVAQGKIDPKKTPPPVPGTMSPDSIPAPNGPGMSQAEKDFQQGVQNLTENVFSGVRRAAQALGGPGAAEMLPLPGPPQPIPGARLTPTPPAESPSPETEQTGPHRPEAEEKKSGPPPSQGVIPDIINRLEAGAARERRLLGR